MEVLQGTMANLQHSWSADPTGLQGFAVFQHQWGVWLGIVLVPLKKVPWERV